MYIFNDIINILIVYTIVVTIMLIYKENINIHYKRGLGGFYKLFAE